MYKGGNIQIRTFNFMYHSVNRLCVCVGGGEGRRGASYVINISVFFCRVFFFCALVSDCKETCFVSLKMNGKCCVFAALPDCLFSNH